MAYKQSGFPMHAGVSPMKQSEVEFTHGKKKEEKHFLTKQKSINIYIPNIFQITSNFFILFVNFILYFF